MDWNFGQMWPFNIKIMDLFITNTALTLHKEVNDGLQS